VFFTAIITALAGFTPAIHTPVNAISVYDHGVKLERLLTSNPDDGCNREFDYVHRGHLRVVAVFEDCPSVVGTPSIYSMVNRKLVVRVRQNYPRFVAAGRIAPEVCEDHGHVVTGSTIDGEHIAVLCSDGSTNNINQ
jgi:hypothetical protein